MAFLSSERCSTTGTTDQYEANEVRSRKQKNRLTTSNIGSASRRHTDQVNLQMADGRGITQSYGEVQENVDDIRGDEWWIDFLNSLQKRPERPMKKMLLTLVTALMFAAAVNDACPPEIAGWHAACGVQLCRHIAIENNRISNSGPDVKTSILYGSGTEDCGPQK